MFATIVYSMKCLFLFKILIQSVRYGEGGREGKGLLCRLA